MKKCIVFLICIFLFSCKNDLKDDKSRFSYAVGQQVGRSLKGQKMHDYVDVTVLAEGIRDALEDKGRLTPQEIQSAMVNAQTRDTPEKLAYKQKNEKFLKENKNKSGIKTTASGLQYQILKAGTGPRPKADNKVKVHYKGQLIDGMEFDSSYKRGEPASFPVGGVIKGWQEALQLMPVGSKWKLFIPASIAYGTRGNPAIPGNSTLVFEVELLGILP